MGFFHQLTEKPWVPRQGNVVELHDGIAFSVPTATLGVRVFLAVVTVLFLLLIMAYGSRMEFEDWRPAPQVGLLWLNTGMLVLSSIAMQWAKIASRRGDGDGVRAGLIAGGAFAVAFLAGQIWAWRQLNMVPVFDITNPAIGFFYLITALHGLHLLGGLVAWGMTTAKAVARFRRGPCAPERGAVYRLLALPARGLAGPFRPAVLGQRQSGPPVGHLWNQVTGSKAMAQPAASNPAEPLTRPEGWPGIVSDWTSDQRAFKNVPWGKAMMWIFLLSDTFIFSCFLLSYMTVRMSTTVPWPNPSEIFALHIGGADIPLILIAIMTFVLISSSGTMAMAVNFGYRRDRVKSARS